MNKKKITLALLLVVAVALSCALIIPTASNGNVAKADGEFALTISSATELRAFATRVADGETFEGQTVALASDIDLGGQSSPWTPINTFAGTFDGQGYTISNMYVNTSVSQQEFEADEDGMIGYGAGFFGYPENAMSVQNVNFDSCTVIGESGAGIVVGDMTFEDCYLKNISITNCTLDARDDVGLLAGFAGYIKIFDCHALNSTINAKGDVGGLVGYAYCQSGYNVTLTECSVENCNISSLDENAYKGSFVGQSEEIDTLCFYGLKTDNLLHFNGGNATVVGLDTLLKDVLFDESSRLSKIEQNGNSLSLMFNEPTDLLQVALFSTAVVSQVTVNDVVVTDYSFVDGVLSLPVETDKMSVEVTFVINKKDCTLNVGIMPLTTLFDLQVKTAGGADFVDAVAGQDGVAYIDAMAAYVFMSGSNYRLDFSALQSGQSVSAKMGGNTIALDGGYINLQQNVDTPITLTFQIDGATYEIPYQIHLLTKYEFGETTVYGKQATGIFQGFDDDAEPESITHGWTYNNGVFSSNNYNVSSSFAGYTLYAFGQGNMYFDYVASGEGGRYDYFEAVHNGVTVIEGCAQKDEISNESELLFSSGHVILQNGVNEITFLYHKDTSGDLYLDRAYVKNIVIEQGVSQVQVTAQYDDTLVMLTKDGVDVPNGTEFLVNKGEPNHYEFRVKDGAMSTIVPTAKVEFDEITLLQNGVAQEDGNLFFVKNGVISGRFVERIPLVSNVVCERTVGGQIVDNVTITNGLYTFESTQSGTINVKIPALNVGEVCQTSLAEQPLTAQNGYYNIAFPVAIKKFTYSFVDTAGVLPSSLEGSFEIIPINNESTVDDVVTLDEGGNVTIVNDSQYPFTYNYFLSNVDGKGIVYSSTNFSQYKRDYDESYITLEINHAGMLSFDLYADSEVDYDWAFCAVGSLDNVAGRISGEFSKGQGGWKHFTIPVLASSFVDGVAKVYIGFDKDSGVGKGEDITAVANISFQANDYTSEIAVTSGGVDVSAEIVNGTVSLPFGDTYNVEIKASELGVGERFFYNNGGENVEITEIIEGFYGFSLTNVRSDMPVTLIYKIDGSDYAVQTILLSITKQGEMADDVIIKGDGITLNNNAENPFVFDSKRSFDGRGYAYRSSNSGQDSSISFFKVTATQPGALAFYGLCSSEENSDLAFYTIGRRPESTTSCNDDNLLSSGIDTGWKLYVIEINQALLDEYLGSVDIYITFAKDSSVDKGEDAFFIAQMAYATGSAYISFSVSDGLTSSVANITAKFANGSILANNGQVRAGIDEITLTANVTNGNYQFYGWKDSAGNIVSRNPSYKFIAMQSETYTAIVKTKGTYFIFNNNTGVFYLSLQEALSEALPNHIISINDNFTLSQDVTVPAGVTLLVPYSLDDVVGYKVGGQSVRASWNDANYLYRTMTIANGATLTVNGKLIVGGVQHYPDQSAQGHTSGAYSKIVNNGNVVVSNGGVFDNNGLVVGTGILTIQHGGVLNTPFVVNNYSGGTNTENLYNSKSFPFVQFDTVNIQCDQSVEYGARVIGSTSLYFWNDIHEQDVCLINYIDTNGNRTSSEGSLLWMHQGSSIDISYDGAKRVNQQVGNVHLGDSGVNTITINGKVEGGEFYLEGYGSGNMVLAIPYTYNFVVAQGGELLVASNRKYMVMPGASVVVNDGGQLTVDGALYNLDGLVQADKSGKSYPSASVLKENGFSASGLVVVGGTMTINGEYAGVLQGVSGGVVTVGNGASLSKTLTLGSAGGYVSDLTRLSLTARLVRQGALVEINAGETYKVFDASASVTLQNATMIEAQRCTETTVAVNTTVNGSFCKWNGTNYVVDVEIFVGEEVENVTLVVNGQSATTNGQGKATLTGVVLDGNNQFSYYTVGKEVATNLHKATFTGNLVTLTEVVKGVQASASNVYEKVFEQGALNDFVLKGDVLYYGGGSKQGVDFECQIDADKYVLQVTLTSEVYSGLQIANVTLKQELATFESYRALVASLKESNDLVADAEQAFEAWNAIVSQRESDEIVFATERLGALNGYFEIVKSFVAKVGGTYGDQQFDVSLTKIDGATVDGKATPVGQYAISQTGDIYVQLQYAGTFGTKSYVISGVTKNGIAKKDVTLTIDSEGKQSVYGASLVDLTASIDGLVLGDTVEQVVTLAMKGVNAGTHDVTYAQNGEKAGYYNIVNAGVVGTYTIVAKQISVSVNAHSDVMISSATQIAFDCATDEVDFNKQTVTYVLSFDSDVVARVSAQGVVTFVGEYAQFTENTTYDVNVECSDANYEVTSIANTIKIVANNDYYTVRWEEQSTKIYDGQKYVVAKPQVVVTATEQIVGASDVTVETLLGSEQAEVVGVGTYTIKVTVAQEGMQTVEYTKTFVVSPIVAELSWRANGFVYDGNEHKASVVVTNALDGEVVTVTQGAYDCVNAGQVTATAIALGGEHSANYVLPQEVTFTYDIEAMDITIFAEDKASTYGDESVTLTLGSDVVPVAPISLADLVDVTCIYAKGANAGEYQIEVTKKATASANYNVTTQNGTYTVSTKQIEVTIESNGSVYGQQFATLTAVVSGLVDGDDEQALYVLSVEQGAKNVGKYDIVGECTNANYEITFAKGNDAYTITPCALTVTVADASQTYGEGQSNLALLASVTQGELQHEDTLASVVAVSREQGSDVANYKLTAQAISDNYDVTFTYSNATYSVYSITKRNATVTLGKQNASFTDSWQTLLDKVNGLLDGATVEGVIEGDDLALSAIITVNGVTLTEQNLASLICGGEHAVVASSANKNYQVSFTNGALVVGKPQISLKQLQNVQLTYSTSAVTVFDWQQHVDGLLASATADTVKATLSLQQSDEVITSGVISEVLPVGTYTLVVQLIETYAYDWAENQVTTFTITVVKQDLSDAITAVGFVGGDAIVAKSVVDATVQGVDVSLSKVLKRDGQEVFNTNQVGEYTLEVTVEDDNYQGSKTFAFTVVEDVKSKIEQLEIKLASYQLATTSSEQYAIAKQLVEQVRALTATDKQQVQGNQDYAKTVQDAKDVWTQYVSMVKTDADVAQQLARNYALEQAIVVMALVTTAYVVSKRTLGL